MYCSYMVLSVCEPIKFSSLKTLHWHSFMFLHFFCPGLWHLDLWLAHTDIMWPRWAANHASAAGKLTVRQSERNGTGKIVGLDEVCSRKWMEQTRLHVLLYRYRMITNTPGDNFCTLPQARGLDSDLYMDKILSCHLSCRVRCVFDLRKVKEGSYR